MDVSALHIFRFRTSLSDELYLFATPPRLSVFRVPLGRFQTWELVFVLSRTVLSCFSTLVKFSLAFGK